MHRDLLSFIEVAIKMIVGLSNWPIKMIGFWVVGVLRQWYGFYRHAVFINDFSNLWFCWFLVGVLRQCVPKWRG